LLILAPNGVDPMLLPDGPTGFGVDAVACFSQVHADLLCQTRPQIPRERCVVTGLGVDLDDYVDPLEQRHVPPKLPPADHGLKVFGRMLYANDPARGLWHVLDVFDEVRRRIPEATLHVAYDFDRQFEHHRWEANWLAEMLWECKGRLETTPGVTNLGQLSRADLVREQLECHVHAMPSDPPNLGSQIHGILQAEMAAAGTPLILSKTEAFPEVFGEAAMILPLPGTYLPAIQRRYDAGDWAQAVVNVMREEKLWTEMSQKSRALAGTMTWGAVITRWEAMLDDLQAHPPTNAAPVPEAVPT
jgi:glycosyltransferase involved in cell wall biosynthesis